MDIGTLIVTFSTRFLGIFIEAVSFLLLGTLISGLIGVFISNDDMARLVPKNPIAATLVGSMLGFIFPVCECGVVPVTRRLYQKGLPVSAGSTCHESDRIGRHLCRFWLWTCVDRTLCDQLDHGSYCGAIVRVANAPPTTDQGRSAAHTSRGIGRSEHRGYANDSFATARAGSGAAAS